MTARRNCFLPEKRAGLNAGGFTLLELIIVCLIISLLLVVGVPAIRDTIFTEPLKSGARKIIGVIREVRETAVREQQAYLVYFDTDRGRIWFEKESQTDPEADTEPAGNALQLPSAMHIQDIRTKADGKLDSTPLVLWVSRQGYMDQTVIHLGDEDDNVLTILISPFLSSIKVLDSYAELPE